MGHSAKKWKVLLVHPSALMYSEVYLRLEPLGLELVAEACRRSGFEVRLLDLQASTHKDYFRTLNSGARMRWDSRSTTWQTFPK